MKHQGQFLIQTPEETFPIDPYSVPEANYLQRPMLIPRQKLYYQ